MVVGQIFHVFLGSGMGCSPAAAAAVDNAEGPDTEVRAHECGNIVVELNLN